MCATRGSRKCTKIVSKAHIKIVPAIEVNCTLCGPFGFPSIWAHASYAQWPADCNNQCFIVEQIR